MDDGRSSGRTTSELVRQAIRRRFPRRVFSVRMLRTEAPELADVQCLSAWLHDFVRSGFLQVRKAGLGAHRNGGSDKSALRVYALAPEVSTERGMTVVREAEGFNVTLDAEWLRRLERVAERMELPSARYLREVIEADVVRREAGAR